ncbi:hypothetical protein VTJ83DRAFT_1550 [Remersonia thermophila]|uniref:DUF6590 domain-containing protein n=1 Tax=Remersonia thermophila TaxID=72144 RepID=A0ABR4DGG4_9PEZI
MVSHAVCFDHAGGGIIVGGACPGPAAVEFDPGIPPSATPEERPPPPKAYGDPWAWDEDEQDYVRVGPDGLKQLYTEYQRAGFAAATSSALLPLSHPGTSTATDHNHLGGGSNGIPKSPPASPGRSHAWNQPLSDEFQIVGKPKRFFTPGRIFKTVWFEPCPPTKTAPTPGAQAQPRPSAWTSQCPAFHGTQPLACFRWFVVVRRRLHYSLCFRITTAAASVADAAYNKTNGIDRVSDYVVLHNANVEPARPSPAENITREPLAVIIEDARQFIAPIARLDCGRVYTVEDRLPVAKIGRVHKDDLDKLCEYYKDSVLH